MSLFRFFQELECAWTGRSMRTVLCTVSLLVIGCATSEEAIKKSNGYYQEGLANLESDQQRAFVSFQKAVQQNPKNKDAHYGLGHIYTKQAKFKEAESEFREVLRIDPEHSEAHTYLGQILARQDQIDEAIKEFRLALANPLYPTPDVARLHLGRALVRQGDLQGAMEAFEDALLSSPPSVPSALVHLELARVYHKLGYSKRAKESLTKVSSLDKGGEYAAAATQLLREIKP